MQVDFGYFTFPHALGLVTGIGGIASALLLVFRERTMPLVTGTIFAGCAATIGYCMLTDSITPTKVRLVLASVVIMWIILGRHISSKARKYLDSQRQKNLSV